jgi:hypothetical protein
MATVAADIGLRMAQERARRISQGLRAGSFGAEHPEAARQLSDRESFFDELVRLCTECDHS